MPRKTAVAKFRLITEHDYLAKHLNKIGIFADPNCPLCNNEEEMTEEHLETCKALPAGSIIEKYWSAQALMASLPNANNYSTAEEGHSAGPKAPPPFPIYSLRAR